MLVHAGNIYGEVRRVLHAVVAIAGQPQQVISAGMVVAGKLYEDFADKLYVYMNSPEGNTLTKAFDAKFPNAEISDVSKVAIILWQGEI